ncbi:aliphatic sulfonate ABC transporter substrate-binding protein [Nocardioides sp. HDW12B]|uniref:aliphatic sulfonate ABC transporter substrate-binding protein n=1 Tax=Nocardioides sp. HDW12B TaxID=2714939 RepID=UPI00140BA480|nr:aliphatic sulfonate ABC transporter substrate-binding protein [Nocardioides sp. HDW12B]QIK67307.1 aliphatic sulfonate ABC transporter substrate-binding protein [Nocardioides sp. HDW12B]
MPTTGTPAASRPTRNPLRATRARVAVAAAALTLASSALAGCASEASGASGSDGGPELAIDFATYNPLSLVIKDQGWLEDELKDEGVSVTWVESTGSNIANQNLRAGAIDVGSTAGSAALLARANGTPIKIIDIYTQPEWVALVVGPDSDIKEVADLKGKTIAATLGTDAYFFLLQALEEAGVGLDEVTIENLQHPDGQTALEGGSVDAWAGLDPMMADAEQNSGAKLIYRNVDFASYGTLDATEDFLAEEPELAQTVVDVYERARQWAIDNPDEAVAILAEESGVEESVAKTVLTERTGFDIDNVPGQAQIDVLEKIGPIFVDSGDVSSQDQVDEALASLIEDEYASKADPARVGGES